MRYLVTFLFLIAPIISFGQDEQKMDSLKAELTKAYEKKDTLELLAKIFNNYLFTNLDSAKVYKNRINKQPSKTKKDSINTFTISSRYYYYKSQLDSSLYFNKKALNIALKLKDNSLKSGLYRKRAILSSRNFNYEDAKKYGKLALEAANESKDWYLIASSSIMLGNQYYKKSRFHLALKHYFKADSLYSSNNKKDRFLANSYDNISSIYIDLKDAKALYYIKKSGEIYRLLKDDEGLAYNHLLRGMYYNAFNKHKQAIPNFEKAMTFYKNYGDVFRLIDVQTRLINSYSGIKNYKKAKTTLIEAEKKLKTSKEKSSFLSFYLNSGQLYVDLQEYDMAIRYFSKAYDIVSKSEQNFSIAYNKEIKKGLTNAYIGKKDFENALKFSQLQLQITDSIYKKNNTQITKELEAKYQIKKKEQEISLLKTQNELVEQQKANQRNQLLGGIGITTLIGLFFFFLYRNRQKTTKKLQELDKAKSNFFTNISHEFRTPLTLISGPIQQLLSKENLSSGERANFEMAARNSKRLLSLVDQLLDISKLETGNLRLKVNQQPILPYIGSLADSFTYTTKEKDIIYLKYITRTKITTYFDGDVLQKIVINLLSNAIKYTPKGGTVICNASVNNNELLVVIKNTGKGLTKTEQTKVFERFYQINKSAEGVGIGLALVKELVVLHKGRISVDSVPNEWTTFTIKLPINRNSFSKEEISILPEIKQSEIVETKSKLDIEKIQEEVPNIENSDHPILLVVDDNHNIRAYVSGIFKNRYIIFEANNGQEGIDLAIKHIPDIIISDVMMPVKNGIELCNTLKKDKRTSHIPIVLLTAKAGKENELDGIKAHADDYITKPFHEELLKERIKKHIEIRNKLQLRYSQEVILRPKDIAITSIDEQFLERLQKILDTKLMESSFSIEDFSKSLSMSRMQLHRKLKWLTGMSASEFIRSQRLKLAAQLLKKSEIPVSQIGYSVGFNDHAYFSKCFKGHISLYAY